MTNCVEDEVKKALNEFRNLLSEYEFDEKILRIVLLKVETIQQPQIIMCLLDLLVEEHENEIELLHSQIQSYDFQDPKITFQNLPSPNLEKIILPANSQIEDNPAFKKRTGVLAAKFVSKVIAIAIDQESLEEILPHDVFVDPVANHMEAFLNSRFVKGFLYEDQVYQQWPLYVTIWIVGAHDQILALISPTFAQTVCFFLQVLKWLHWIFHFT